MLKRTCVALLIAGMSMSAVYAQPTTAPSEVPVPSTLPVSPSAPAVTVDAEAQAMLEKLVKAIGGTKGFSASGTFSADIDVAGQKEQTSKEFTSSYGTGLKFKHEIKDEVIVGGTGEKIYAYRPDLKQYLQVDSPKEKGSTGDLPALVPQILRVQNPLVLLALTQDVRKELERGASRIRKTEDVTIGETAYPAIAVDVSDGAVITMAMDSKTDLVKRVAIDFSQVLKSQQVPGVNKATLVVEYTTLSGEAAEEGAFAWSAPEGAQDASKPEAPEAREAAPSPLEGKPAIDFALKNDEGKEVKLADQKGSVVVVDFWATWCPPCREGLPHLDKMLEAKKEKGLKVYAVNLRETPAEVKAFREKTGLKLPVLMDSEGKVAEEYQVAGIPTTVVIDRKGVVKKVVVGFDPSTTAEVEAAVEAALAEK